MLLIKYFMPFSYYIFFVEIHSFKSLFYSLSLNPVIFYYNNLRNNLDFCISPLILNMNVNRLMIVGIKEKSYSKY